MYINSSPCCINCGKWKREYGVMTYSGADPHCNCDLNKTTFTALKDSPVRLASSVTGWNTNTKEQELIRRKEELQSQIRQVKLQKEIKDLEKELEQLKNK